MADTETPVPMPNFIEQIFSGTFLGIWPPEKMIAEQEKLIEMQKEIIENLEKQVELLLDPETTGQCIQMIERIKTLEKDNADLKRLVALKSEEVHLEDQIISRDEKKGTLNE
jgi:hypothetical protein